MTLDFRKLPMHRSAQRGFTITELLVVVGIIVLLSSIGLVVGKKAFGAADKTRLRAQLHTIELALDAYKSDFGSYPTTDSNAVNGVSDEVNREELRGARTLAKALVAATPGVNPTNSSKNPSFEDQDGKVGPGFRVLGRSGSPRYKGGVPLAQDELQGKEYGPYVQGGAIKWSKTNDDGSLDEAKDYDDTTVLLDANDNVILYYPQLGSPVPPTGAGLTTDVYVSKGKTESSGTFTGQAMFRATDNEKWLSPFFLRLHLGLGPIIKSDTNLLNPTGAELADNRTLNPGEVLRSKGPYLLISSGRDGIFGLNPNDQSLRGVPAPDLMKRIDDVTNFND